MLIPFEEKPNVMGVSSVSYLSVSNLISTSTFIIAWIWRYGLVLVYRKRSQLIVLDELILWSGSSIFYTFLHSSEYFKDYFCAEIFYVSLKFGFDFRRNYISVRCKVPNQKSHENVQYLIILLK